MGGKTISPIFLCVQLKLHTHKYCMSVSNCERLYDSWVCGLAEKLLYWTLSDVMINCNCFNDWDYSLLVFNEVSDSYLILWIDCYFKHNNSYENIYVVVPRMIMMTSCPYFILSTPLSLNMSTCLEIEVSIKIKYGHEGIMIILRTTTYIILVIWFLMLE